MKIAVLGTGFVGSTLGRRLAQSGHEIVFGSRMPQGDRAENLKGENPGAISVTGIAEAANQCDTILFAVPWPVARETVTAAGGLAGKTLIDCTNPLNERFDGIELGFTESAAEKIAEWAPAANVVKAFNTISAATMADPGFQEHAASVFYCGDDANAKAIVSQLIRDLGFDGIDAGDLHVSRYLEPMAMLCIELAVKKRVEGNFALKVLKR